MNSKSVSNKTEMSQLNITPITIHGTGMIMKTTRTFLLISLLFQTSCNQK